MTARGACGVQIEARTPRYSCRKTWSGVTRDVDLRRNVGYQLELPCEFDTTDPAEFVEHMKTVHAGGMSFSPPAWKRLPKRLWTGPRLTEDGKAFEPVGLDIGAAVTWSQLVPTGDTYVDEDLGACGQERPILRRIDRTGQVWCKGDRGVWVVPDDEIADEAEIAVLVRETSGRLEQWGTFRATGLNRRSAA